MRLSKTTIQVITAAAVAFLLLLVVVLIINVVQLSSAKAKARELDRLYAESVALYESLEGDIDYLSSAEFIEQYAREYLDMVGAGEQAFKVKD